MKPLKVRMFVRSWGTFQWTGLWGQTASAYLNFSWPHGPCEEQPRRVHDPISLSIADWVRGRCLMHSLVYMKLSWARGCDKGSDPRDAEILANDRGTWTRMMESLTGTLARKTVGSFKWRGTRDHEQAGCVGIQGGKPGACAERSQFVFYYTLSADELLPLSFTLNMALMALWSDSQDLPTLAALSYWFGVSIPLFQILRRLW